MSQIDIEVTNLSKVYNNGGKRVAALEDVSFQVARGSFFCIVGPSGCGKSTLLRLLTRLSLPTSGKVWLDEDRFNSGIAYVQQSALLLPWRTLLQNAALGRELKEEMNSERIESIRDEVVKYGLGGFENCLPEQLSGGMNQRVAVIRALKSGPSLMFCDEPFSAIDFVTRLELNTRFKQICRNYRITTVFVTHNIEEAIFLGDEIFVMSGRPGRKVASYTPRLSVGAEDAVRCRKSKEFGDYFLKIWADLKGSHAGTP